MPIPYLNQPVSHPLKITGHWINLYVKALTSKKIHSNLCFSHPPKCGGVSLHNALCNHFLNFTTKPHSNIFRMDSVASLKIARDSKRPAMEVREVILKYILNEVQNQKGNNFVSGHFPFNERIRDIYSKEWCFISMIRNPVNRWISEYLFNKYKESPHCKHAMDIEEYLNSPKGQSSGRGYVTYFSGETDLTIPEEVLIKKAIQNISSLDLIGILEKKDDFLRQVQEKFGVKLILRQENTKPSQAHKELLSVSVKRRIHELCQPDILIYEHVLNQN